MTMPGFCYEHHTWCWEARNRNGLLGWKAQSTRRPLFLRKGVWETCFDS